MSLTNFHLDLKDRKILSELDLNARQPCSQIAKKVGLSTEVVSYRIKRLEEENIITQYQTIINLSKLNVIQFKICLSLQHITSKKYQELIEKIKENKSIKWLVSCKGNWDLLIAVETDSFENVELLKNNILSEFAGYINQKAIAILVEATTYDRDYLLKSPSTLNRSRIIMEKEKTAKIEPLDLEIIKILSKNARKTIIEIALQLKTTARIVNYRIKQLQKNKIILGFKIALNYEKIGILFFKTMIYIDNPNEERIKSLKQYCAMNKNIIHHVNVLGNWDLEPEFEVYSEAEFNCIISEIKDKYSDIIKQIDIITISKEHKFVYF